MTAGSSAAYFERPSLSSFMCKLHACSMFVLSAERVGREPSSQLLRATLFAVQFFCRCQFASTPLSSAAAAQPLKKDLHLLACMPAPRQIQFPFAQYRQHSHASHQRGHRLRCELEEIQDMVHLAPEVQLGCPSSLAIQVEHVKWQQELKFRTGLCSKSCLRLL